MMWQILAAILVCLMAGSKAQNDTSAETETATVLILGAGMAGISAAKRLKDLGINDFLIIEGSDRIGGRARQQDLGGYKVQLGCLWAVGVNNPLLELVMDRNISIVATDYDDYIVYNEDADEVTAVTDALYEGTFGEALVNLEDLSDSLISQDAPDISMRAASKLVGWNPQTPEEMLVDQWEHDFDASVTPEASSSKYFYNYKYEAELVIVDEDEGFTGIIDTLKNEAMSLNDSTEKLVLNTVVAKIEQNETHVIAHTTDGRRFVGEQAIVTFSLGVLQHKLVQFEPDLPDWKWHSIFGYEFGYYLHFYIQFPSAFWDAEEWILYASRTRGYYPFWQNFNKHWPGSNILQCTVTMPESTRLSRMTDQEILDEAYDVLRGIYGKRIPRPIGIVVPRWSTDPLFMGTYSDWTSGFSNSSHQALKAPVGRVNFAGEHTSYTHYGYLHGAYEEGIFAADKVSKCLNDKESCEVYKAPYENRGCTYKKASNYDKHAVEENGTCEFRACPRRASGSGVSKSGSTTALAAMLVVISYVW